MKKTKIAALLLSAVLSVSAFSVPTFAAETAVITIAANETSWNGKTALEAGKTYIVDKSITVTKKITIPSKTTLIVKSGCTMTIKSSGKLYIKGTLKIEKKATVKASGTFYLYKSKNVKNYGTLSFGSTAKATVNGRLYNYSTGVIKGDPKSLKVGTASKITNKGKITTKALLTDTTALPNEKTIIEFVKPLVDAVIFDADFAPIVKAAVPEAAYNAMLAEMVATGISVDEFLALMTAAMGEMSTITFKDSKGEEHQISIIDIASTEISVSSIKAISAEALAEYQKSIDEVNAQYGLSIKCTSGCTADVTLTIKTIDGAEYSSEAEKIDFVLVDGKYYLTSMDALS